MFVKKMFKGRYRPDYRNWNHKYLLGEIEKALAGKKTKRQTTKLIRNLEEYIRDSAHLKFAFDDVVDCIAKEHGKEYERMELFQELLKKKRIFDSTYQKLESHGYLEGQLDYV